MTTKTLPVLSFAKLEMGMPMPHLLDIQTRAFQALLQPDGKGATRADVGLERVFKDLFPIQDVNGNYSLEFVKFALGEPKYTVEECIERDMTYSVPLKATLQLVVMEEVGEGKAKRPKNIIEKEVYLGELPILTPLGTFVINGAERVIVSQLHRSPGVVFEESIHPNGQRLFSARIIPFRGSWVEFTIDIHDVIFVHIDKKKKFPATALLRAFGYGTNAEILKLFYATKDIDITGKLEGRAQKREVLGTLLAADVPDPENKKGEALGKVGDELTLEKFNTFRRAGITRVKVFAGYTTLDLREEEHPTTTRTTEGKHILAFDVADPETGEVLAEAGREVTDAMRKKLLKANVARVEVLLPPGRAESPLIKNTLAKDPTRSEAEALEQIYQLLRPGEAPNLETARQALERLFFHPKRYDLGRVGRYKINQRLKVAAPTDVTVLTEEDFIAIIRYLIELREGRGYTDDIDHLGNRRVRSVGELIANQFSVGLSRMARLIKERMSINNDPERITLDDLVNARTVSAVIQAFFGSSQLSQFMDQTNPLAELTHKRRLSALGPGGLTRERAGFEVRDVHYSQYGRMCPIETPEGPNIGLITSLSCYAQVNDLGFIETPYRIVKSGKVTDDIRWLSASEEEDYAIAQANARLTEDGRFADDLVLCRKRDDYPLLPAERVDFMDVAPEQLVSIAAALIPFLEHDDANRALMGSNMQRQSVPLLFPQAPAVGTGLEERVARDSGAVVIARRAGVVQRVTADEVIIDTGDEERRAGEHPLARLKQHDRYRLKKFWRTNQDTAINQRPLVHVGQRVKAGQIVADGSGTERGELALGANVLVAFMPWYGHNFEDAIVLSERLVKDDVYSSIHIQELELHVRDTKRGREEITREIPNVAEESLVDLDERGIVRIGAHVKAGDILVGKITPKGETELSPEEKLLTAIFGEKAKDVKDSSLKVPPGMEGVVIDVKIFSRVEDQVVEKDRGERIGEVRRVEAEEKARISDAVFTELTELLAGHEVGLMLKAGTVEEYLPAGTKLTRERLAEVRFADVDLKTLRVSNKAVNERVRAILDAAQVERAKIEEKAEDQIDKILQPDELPPGVIQLVKVYIAEKRKISVGDKMAGRHGNKGIIARIVPEEDMPFLPDGTPVDIVLNPLGVPSRMNVGQILETHLGWCARILGFEAKTPVFQGADETEIGVLLRLAGLTWAADALRLDARPPVLDAEAVRRIADDLRRLPAQNGGRPDLTTAGLAVLASRTLSQETRDVHHQFVDFLRLAAKALAERELVQKRLEREQHAAQLEAAELSKTERAALKTGLKDVEKFLEHDKAAEVLETAGYPALAALLGPKSEADVDQAASELLRSAGLSPAGKARLRDGRTGELFTWDVTVGSIYMMKLSHLVDDKIHARSIGPYSLVTQQPLAGKAQFGGQRFGEMEVWALEAYGAAHTLQEILTVKSDDVNGRSRVYEAIVKGQNLPKPGIPESFNVLVKELQALGLKVTLGTTEDVEE
ncbi:MAG: DNA-directed RNA polymerase subunit beta [Gemmatimonadetes bacterium]|nr:MAG: DNA-directed RNA polymerase subunit beta [Gemmatimonadota bacterium]PYP63200.1 MAG: DNA-directed RNA polymerase subunit beta [Gemmatimonadota bacterium]